MFSKIEIFLCFCVTLVCSFNFKSGASESSLPVPHSHTCVVGAGYSGLAAARYLKRYGLNFTVYEAAEDIGGNWRFDPRTGTDEYGVPIFTSQYKNLRVNTPRQTMEYNGFPFPEKTMSFPSGRCFFKYLKKFVREFGLMKYIKLHSFVTSVKLEDGYWSLTYTDAKSKTNCSVQCDFVVIANGQYVKPFMPSFDGQEEFKGKILHSHDYKDAEDYKGRNVLLVGAGASGQDLSVQLVNIVNKLVHSHHLVYNEPVFPENYKKKPDIKAFKSNGVVFEDGSFEEVDTMIFCTGFEFIQPFIHKNAELWTDTSVLHLYQNIINIRHPTMAFIGVVKRVVTRVLDAQAQYIASLVAGKFQLPSKNQMMKLSLTDNSTLDADTRKVYVKDLYKYFATLTKEAGIDRVPPVLVKMQEYVIDIRIKDFDYRNYDYKIIDDYNFKTIYNPRNETCDIA